jgi:hypothetical protein
MNERVFAWYPVKTKQGEWVWLRYVNRTWNNELNPWGYDGYSGNDGGWEYE